VTRARTSLVAVLLVALVAGCTNPRAASNAPAAQTVTLPSPGVPGGPSVSGELTIFVADELRPLAEALRDAFVAHNPAAEVALTVGGGKLLIVEAVGGPRPDVYMASSADVAGLNVYLSDIEEISALGTDEYVIATPRGNPNGITDLASFSEAEDPVVCSDLQPSAGQDPPEALPMNPERDPQCGERAAAAVRSGDLLAALLPRSALGTARNTVEVVEIPAEDNIQVSYRYALLSAETVTDGFENFLQSKDGHLIRARFGYTS
jgi:molybdate transport system substrate-binding protein